MKIVIINGQNHKGNTWNLGRLFISKIEGENTIKEFFLPKDLNHFCTGCCACLKSRKSCPYFKEKEPIINAMLDSDLIIITTPNYCMMPSAPLKAFLDLFFTNWLSHKPYEEMFSKKAVILSTTAGAGVKKAIKPVKNNLVHWGIPEVYTYGCAIMATSWDEMSEKNKVKINKDVSKLVKRVVKRKKVHIGIYTRIIFWFYSGMQKANWSASEEEKQYWVEKGWLDSKKPWKL